MSISTSIRNLINKGDLNTKEYQVWYKLAPAFLCLFFCYLDFSCLFTCKCEPGLNFLKERLGGMNKWRLLDRVVFIRSTLKRKYASIAPILGILLMISYQFAFYFSGLIVVVCAVSIAIWLNFETGSLDAVFWLWVVGRARFYAQQSTHNGQTCLSTVYKFL